MSWTTSELREAADRYERDVESEVGPHYARLAAQEARRFVAWLPDGGAGAPDPAPRDPETPRVPPRIAGLVRDWIDGGRRPQHASTWHRSAWYSMLPEHKPVLADFPDELDRPWVRSVAAQARQSPEAALRAYLAVMVWAWGTGPLGPFRTRRILDETSDAPERLMRAAREVAGSIRAGYEWLAKAGRMKYLGPAYGTKFLFFTQPEASEATALILDSRVTEALLELAGETFDPLPWQWPTYQRYLELVSRWAALLGIRPDDLEYLLFLWASKRHGGQWAEDE